MGKQEILPKRLDVLEVGNDTCRFRINVDVLNEAFGAKRSMYAKASYPDKKDTWILGIAPGDKFLVWMPKLYGNRSEWVNSISNDGTLIFETAEPTRNGDWTDYWECTDFQRIVFVKDSPKSPYRFVGVFENGDMSYKKHTYRRIATKIKLIGDPAMRIELLDDIRREP